MYYRHKTHGNRKKKNKQFEKQKKKKNRLHLPLRGMLDRRVVIRVRTVRTAGVYAEVDLFLSVDSRVGEGSRRSSNNGARRRGGGDLSIFPSDARSAIKIDVFLYSGLGRRDRDSVTPVRRREDTEGDGDARVKVQVEDCPVGVLSRMPSELLGNNSKGESRKDLTGLSLA